MPKIKVSNLKRTDGQRSYSFESHKDYHLIVQEFVDFLNEKVDSKYAFKEAGTGSIEIYRGDSSLFAEYRVRFYPPGIVERARNKPGRTTITAEGHKPGTLEKLDVFVKSYFEQ